MYEENVQRGIAALDARRPNWRATFNVAKLDVGSMSDCPVGQAYEIDPEAAYTTLPNWQLALHDLGAPPFAGGGQPWLESEMRYWAVQHGFDVEGGEVEYDRLTATWQRTLDPDNDQRGSE